MQHALCHLCFQAKQRNGGNLEFTNQSLGIYTELCQVLFKHLLLFEPVNVAVEYFIDCSLTNQTDQKVWIPISPRLTVKNDTPLKVCNKGFWKVHINNCFSWANPFGCGTILKYELKERHSKRCSFDRSMIQQLYLMPISRGGTGATDSTLNLLVPGKTSVAFFGHK